MLRSGIFLSSMAASPPSTFFSCAFKTEVAATRAVAVKKTAAGFVYLFRICLARSRFTERMILVGNGSMLALLNAVHANHTPACINLMLLKVDAGCLAVA